MINVRFRGKSGHDADVVSCPLMTQSGHCLPFDARECARTFVKSVKCRYTGAVRD